MRTVVKHLVSAILAAASIGCSRGAPPAAATADAGAGVIVQETFLTEAVPDQNVDSLAVWRRGSPALVMATAKTGNTLFLYDAATGQFLRRIGTSGVDPGQFRRPNGILVLDDYAFVVERDNHRVQVVHLPDGASVLVFGSDLLRRPYGIAGYAEPGGYLLFITDNYETAAGGYPPDAELGSRVHRFRVTGRHGRLAATHEIAFGETAGPGVLRKVETIGADRLYDRVLVAEEDVAVRSLFIYSPAGTFTGQSLSGWFATEPEGLALYPCGSEGFWIATDQNDQAARNVFHVFERRTLKHRGSFRGATTHTTDGVAVTPGTLGTLEGGAFYALHNDEQVAAFAWSAIEKALSLEACRERVSAVP
jgi:3-phytase